ISAPMKVGFPTNPPGAPQSHRDRIRHEAPAVDDRLAARTADQIASLKLGAWPAAPCWVGCGSCCRSPRDPSFTTDTMVLIGTSCHELGGDAELKVIYVQPPTGSNSVIASRKADPYDYVVSVNERRRHLTTTQCSEVAAKLLKARPDLPDRAIAKTAQVDHL